MVEPLRVCRVCGLEAFTEEDLENFVKEKRLPYGRKAICKPCMNKYVYDRSGAKHRKNTPYLRKCIVCGLEAWTEEDLELFKKGKTSKHNRANICKKCDSERKKKYYEAHRKKSNDASRKYYETHQEKIREYFNKWQRDNPEKTRKQKQTYRAKRPLNYLALYIKTRAKKKGIKFDLDENHLQKLWDKCSGICPMTGVPMTLQPGKRGKPNPFVISVDRIIPEKGYTKGNVRIVSLWYNFTRRSWGDEFTVEMCRRVIEHIGV